jgi:hypothetical protein
MAIKLGFLTALMFILVSFTLSSQTTTRKGYYNAHMGDSIGPNRTTADKAILDCYGMSQNNPDGLEIYYTLPARVVVDFPIDSPVIVTEPQFLINSVTQEVGQTSVVLNIEFSTSDLKFAYVRFRPVGGIWQRTNDDPAYVHWIGALDRNTEYEYIVYGENMDGVKINSDLLTFITN